jgi:glycosyltransferase involved in cell wall biosynthesis
VLVVAAVGSDAARIVTESGCGLAADPDDPAAVAAAIRELRSDPVRLGEMGRRARETAGKYARVNELQRFFGIMEEAVSERNGGTARS